MTIDENWSFFNRCSALKITNSKITQGLYLIQNTITVCLTIITLIYLYFGNHAKCQGISPQRKNMLVVMLWIGLLGAFIASSFQLVFIFDKNLVQIKS
jgi:RsiW-degrading membrane proteinase PrsW (M82 family)